MGGYSPYPSLFVDDAARQVLLLDPRTCRGYNLAQRPRLSSSTQESFDNVLALRVPAEMARPRVPHVRTVALNVFVHRIGPPSTPVISLYDRQLKRSVMALVIEETVPDDSAMDTPLYLQAFL